MKFLSLFAGIGGFDLGLERAGMECVGQVEIDPFCQKVLEKHWPNVKRMGDIRDVKGDEFGTVDLICGGFPCQPFSTAGKRKGKGDDRYLWPEMLRVIKAIMPTWIIGENVSGIIDLALNQVLSDLENAGYDFPRDRDNKPCVFCIPACSVNAPHRRDRVWIIANSTSLRWECRESITGSRMERQFTKNKKQPGDRWSSQTWGMSEKFISDTYGEFSNGTVLTKNSNELEGKEKIWGKNRKFLKLVAGIPERLEAWKSLGESPLVRVDDGIPDVLDRLKALGNAVVPQIVEIIGRAIMEVENLEPAKESL